MTTGIIKQHHRRPFVTGGLHKGWIWNNLKQDNAIIIVTLFWGRWGLREDFWVMLQSCWVSMLPTPNSRCVCSNQTPFETYYVTPVTRSPNAPINTITRGTEREREREYTEDYPGSLSSAHSAQATCRLTCRWRRSPPFLLQQTEHVGPEILEVSPVEVTLTISFDLL